MGFIDAVTSLFHSDSKREEQEKQEAVLRAAFKARCGHFKALLSANKRALVSMANLEEAARGEHFFSMSFVRANCTTVITNVFNMVRHLNGLSADAHLELFDRLKDLQQNITEVIAPKDAIIGPLVLPLTETGFAVSHEVGGKMASLGEAWRRLGQNIPEGFVVTASGYRHFLRHNKLQDEINRRIQMTDLGELDAVFALSSSLQQLIMSASIPDDLAENILSHASQIASRNADTRFAVRSSAIGEDSHGSSFAGQYRSELNITTETLLDTYKEVVAGKYGVTAMTYRFHRGIPDDEVPMCVGCLVMVDALAGGVAYSADPLNRKAGVTVNAVPGLPKAVVDGSGEVDVFHVSREVPHTIIKRDIPVKRVKQVCAQDEGITSVTLSEEEGAKPCLSDEQVLEVAKVALGFEVFYGTPQDVEWAYTRDGRLTVLQSRPLPEADGEDVTLPVVEGARLLIEGGVTAAPGAGFGKIFLVRRNADMLRFPQGAVLVVEQAHARWAPILGRAAAVISDYGGAAGHLASVAREYGIPALFGLSGVTKTLEPEASVTVDADACRIYEGAVAEVLERKRKTRPLVFGSPVHTVLERVSRFIVPLHLLDPTSADFAPASCRSLHDITRFCHEKAVEEMFRLDESLFSSRCGKQLKYRGSKLQYFMVNIENGFCEPVEGRYVELSQICCEPMLALWNGMISIPWAGPQATGRGFLAVVAESASNPELEITSESMRMTRNYFMVDKDYCNLQASFGYHFCTVEAQAGPLEQENYVSFHFKGGAANLSRRKLRVSAISDVLTENGFIVDIKEDALSARAEELPQKEALALLRIIGFLLIHSRQMDAALHGEDSRGTFADSLRQGIAQVLAEREKAVSC